MQMCSDNVFTLNLKTQLVEKAQSGLFLIYSTALSEHSI